MHSIFALQKDAKSEFDTVLSLLRLQLIHLHRNWLSPKHVMTLKCMVEKDGEWN